MNKPVEAIKTFLRTVTEQDTSTSSEDAFNIQDDLVYFTKDGTSHRLTPVLKPSNATDIIPGDIVVVDARTKLFAMSFGKSVNDTYAGNVLKLLKPVRIVKMKITYKVSTPVVVHYSGHLSAAHFNDPMAYVSSTTPVPMFEDSTYTATPASGASLQELYITGTFNKLQIRDAVSVEIYDAPYLTDVSNMFDDKLEQLIIHDNALDDVVDAHGMLANAASLTNVPDISLPSCTNIDFLISGDGVEKIGVITAPLAASSSIIDCANAVVVRGLLAPLAYGEVIKGASFTCIPNIEVKPSSTINAPALKQPNATELQAFATSGRYIAPTGQANCEAALDAIAHAQSEAFIFSVKTNKRVNVPSSSRGYVGLNGVIQTSAFTPTLQDTVNIWTGYASTYTPILYTSKAVHVERYNYHSHVQLSNMPIVEEFTHAPGAFNKMTDATGLLRDCPKLVEVELDLPKVTLLPSALRSCSSLRRASVNAPLCTNSSGLMSECNNLRFIDELILPSVTTGNNGGMFANSPILTIHRYKGSNTGLPASLCQPDAATILSFGASVDYTSSKNLGRSKVIVRVDTQTEGILSPDADPIIVLDKPNTTVVSDAGRVTTSSVTEFRTFDSNYYYIFSDSFPNLGWRTVHVIAYDLTSAHKMFTVFNNRIKLLGFGADPLAFSNLKDASHMFNAQSALTTQPNIDYTKVTDASFMFYATSFHANLHMPEVRSTAQMLRASSSPTQGSFYIPKSRDTYAMFMYAQSTSVLDITVGDVVNCTKMFAFSAINTMRKWVNVKRPVQPIAGNQLFDNTQFISPSAPSQVHIEAGGNYTRP